MLDRNTNSDTLQYICTKMGWKINVACVLGVIFFIVGLFNLIVFPFIFTAEIKSNLKLSVDEDGYKSLTTFYWSRPPVDNRFSYYFFNITNPDDVGYNGAKPHLHEVGPYNFIYNEHKENMSWLPDGTVWYQNYKTWTYDPLTSCEGCDYHDLVMLPNAALLAGMVNMNDPRYADRVSPVLRLIVQLGLLVLGEYPCRTVRVGDVLFDGYHDPLVDVANSALLDMLSVFNNGSDILPFPVPKIPKLAYFFKYNNSADESYLVNTGANSSKYPVGKVIEWANLPQLPWWYTQQSNAINGSDGSLFPPNLKKNEKLYMFNSFLCRSIYVDFEEESTVQNIPVYKYRGKESVYDTTLAENRGMRYRNPERVNYFPDYPRCPDPYQMYLAANQRSQDSCSSVDCHSTALMCNQCCNRSWVDGTFMLPPGMFPLQCFPGKLQEAPFPAVFSPPHFVYSPPGVHEAVEGLSPDRDLHTPLIWNIEPNTAGTMHVVFRIQASLPMYQDKRVITLSNVRNAITPSFWLQSYVYPRQHILDTTYHAVVLLPKVVFWLGIALILIGLGILLIITFSCMVRRRKASLKLLHN